MTQEMHVLRPARFFTGDFKRTIEQSGLVAKAVINNAPKMDYEPAAEIESRLLQLVKRHSGSSWGYGMDAVGFSGQLGFAAWHHLRAFAAYEDHPFPKFLIFGRHPFDKGFRPSGHPALILSREKRRTTFPNLVFANDNNGFFFPVKIAFPIETQWGWLGSSFGLQREVQRVAAAMRLRGYHHHELEHAIGFLDRGCASSIALNLPIVIDG